MQNIKDELEKLLQKDNRLTTDGKVMKNKVVELAHKLDKKLLKLLMRSDIIRNHFFEDIGGTLIFDKVKFQDFVNLKEFVEDSYTKYKNKIGLQVNDDYIVKSKDVTLVWPYKDCVLEGGQTKEEEENREEIFWNETLAPDQINKLLSPKAFSNFKKYDKNGEHKLSGEVNFSEENLLIRGNNLLALHSLKERFTGQFKLIYIDPPYYFKEKQSADAFAYNSNFKLSTWLTFMKNRIEIAKELLAPNGLFYVQTNEDGQAHLKVLMDSIFTEKKFVSQISWQRTSEGRSALGQGSSFINNSTEYILCYAKENKPSKTPIKKRVEATEKALNQYSSIFTNEGERQFEKTIYDGQGNPINIYKHFNYHYEKLSNNTTIKDRLSSFNYLVREAAQQKESSLQQKILSELNPDHLYSVEYTPTAGVNKGKPKHSYYINGSILLFLKDYAETDGQKVYRLSPMNDFWSHDEIPVTGIAKEGDVNLKRGKKPEKLLQRIIEMSTKPGDLVLDYHLGSGTTAAVAHKLQRKFVGIEQLDYGDEDSLKRLLKVLRGDNSGISQELKDWNGGGSFIYFELAKDNARFIDQIENAKDTEALKAIWKAMQQEGFISYRVDETKVFEDDEYSNFFDLSLEEQKQVLIRTLDLNHLYINYSEIEDEGYNIDPKTKQLNRQFYSND